MSEEFSADDLIAVIGEVSRFVSRTLFIIIRRMFM